MTHILDRSSVSFDTTQISSRKYRQLRKQSKPPKVEVTAFARKIVVLLNPLTGRNGRGRRVRSSWIADATVA